MTAGNVLFALPTEGGFQMSDLFNTLRGTEFFNDLGDDHIHRVIAISKQVEFPTRHIIFREDDPAKDVYVLLTGRVSLVFCAPKTGCRQLMEVGPGELLGWSPLVGRVRLSDTAHTLTPCTALAFNADEMLKLCADNPRFGFEFMHRAAQTL